MKFGDSNPGCPATNCRLSMHGYFGSKFWPKKRTLYKAIRNDFVLLTLDGTANNAKNRQKIRHFRGHNRCIYIDVLLVSYIVPELRPRRGNLTEF